MENKVTVFCPFSTWEHFVWPLSYCVLADICNHTWIPECGIENETDYKRLFIDPCDMWEYNCDNKKEFSITNYSVCFQYSECITTPPKFYRMGDYRFDRDRKVVYDPMNSQTEHRHHHYSKPMLRTTTIPNLPAYMLHGKRRHTPDAKRRMLMLRAETKIDVNVNKGCANKQRCSHSMQIPTTSMQSSLNRKQIYTRTTKKKTQKPTAARTKKTFKTRMATVILKNVTVFINGRFMHKIIKGFVPKKTTKEESGFLE